jgi:hypothetical protein
VLKRFPFAIAFLVCPWTLASCWAVTQTADEARLRDQWVEAVFAPTTNADHPSVKILSEDAPEAITRGRSWRGTPFQLGDKTYTHGLGFNSTKRLLVHLGEPCEHFIADVGLENNDDTRRGAAVGQGSVTFHVAVAGQEVFASKVLR